MAWCFFLVFFQDLRLLTQNRKQNQRMGPDLCMAGASWIRREDFESQEMKTERFCKSEANNKSSQVSAHRPGVIKLESTKQDLDSIIQALGIRTISQRRSQNPLWDDTILRKPDNCKSRECSGSLLLIIEVASE